MPGTFTAVDLYRLPFPAVVEPLDYETILAAMLAKLRELHPAFNALVESAALDIHAYIIQCNNRHYGDSRIRAPYKDRWKRDLLRVKGGNHDYCITGEINVLALRQFQSSHRSPVKPFKPVPDGFMDAMDHNRKVLPEGNPK